MKMYITVIRAICKLTGVGRKLLTNTLKIWKLEEMSSSSMPTTWKLLTGYARQIHYNEDLDI